MDLLTTYLFRYWNIVLIVVVKSVVMFLTLDIIWWEHPSLSCDKIDLGFFNLSKIASDRNYF